MPEPRRTGYFSLLHADPCVVASPDWEVMDPASAVWSIFDAVAPRTAYLVTHASWRLAPPTIDRLRRIAAARPHVGVTVICTTAEEARTCRHAGLRAIHCSQNALVREDLYRPRGPDEAEPVHAAIYDARWARFKRHHLTTRIPSLALVATSAVKRNQMPRWYAVPVRLALRDATWVLAPWSAQDWLPAAEVVRAYRTARVGLCLSEVEGAMFASIQYLLAGLPVVTTRNWGGRDEFFTEPHVRWVDARPGAVAAGVSELIAMELDPWEIRTATLAKIAEHRERFRAEMCRIIRGAGGDPGRWARGWPDGLPDKLRRPSADPDVAIGEITAARQGSVSPATGHESRG